MNIYQRPLRPNELMHFGVLGMHWGVRRYQNPDGTLTEAGKKRYGSDEKKAKELLKLEADDDPKKFRDALINYKPVKRFMLKSPEAEELMYARLNKENVSDKINENANKQAMEAVGGRMFQDILMEGDTEALSTYMAAGKKYAESEEAISMTKESLERLDKAERAFEKKGREFVNDLFGEYGKLESNNPTSLSYDLKTKKMSKQTLADRAAFELYRKSGGRIRG